MVLVELEEVLECIPHLLALCDTVGCVKKANSKWKEVFGKEEVCGNEGRKENSRSWLSVVYTCEVERAKEKWNQHVNANEMFETTHRLRNHAGEYRWFHSFSRKLGEEGYLVTHTDVNKEELLLQACQESSLREETLTRRVMHATDPVLTIDAQDGTILTVNHAVEKYLQFTPNELVGKSCTVLMDDKSAFRHANPDGYMVNFKKNVQPGHQTAIGTSSQIQAKRKDGKFIPITLIIDSYYKNDTHIYIAVLRPITPEIDLQQQLKKSKDAFLSTISHELRTPLFGLMGTLSLFHARALDAATAQDVAQMEAHAMRLLSQVNNMIDFYLLNFLQTAPCSLPFSIQKLISDVSARMQGLVRPEVAFSTHFGNELPQLIVSDPNLVEHVVINLLSNSLRFTHKGEVEVHVGFSTKQCYLSLASGQEALQIKVKDTGIGIEPEFYPQVFQPFSQEDNSDKREYKGAGLGLAMVKSIVNLLGGVVTFNSCTGYGTEFIVSIPVDIVKIPSPTEQTTTQANTTTQSPLNSPQTSRIPLSHNLYSSQNHSPQLNTSETQNVNWTHNTNFDPQENILSQSTNSISEVEISAGADYNLKRAGSCPMMTMKRSPVGHDPPTTPSNSPPSPSPSPSSASSPFSSCPSLQSSHSAPLPKSGCSLRTSTQEEVVPLEKRVLVVEDDPMSQMVIKRMLNRLKCEVTLAANGQEAVEILFETTSTKYAGFCAFDIIIVDCQMPVMDGYTLTQHIRNWEHEQKNCPHMLVLALSASISADHEARCLRAGMDGFMAKPITLQMLYSQITSYGRLLTPKI